MSGRYVLCRAKWNHSLHLRGWFRVCCKILPLTNGGVLWLPPQSDEHQSIRLGDGYELDLRPRRLRRGSHVLKLERIPLEILVLLLEHKDEIVTRDEIVSRVWGKGVFLDTDNSIRGAIRKLRQALKDDAECPRFIRTVTGQGYLFIAPVAPVQEENLAETPSPEASTVLTSEQNLVSEPNGWLPTSGLRSVGEQQDRTAAKLPAAENVRGQRNWLARKWLLAWSSVFARTARNHSVHRHPEPARLTRKLPKSLPSRYCL